MKAFNIEELRLAARRRLPRAVFDFIDGGAEDELTLRGNRAAFEKVRLLRKVLVGVSRIDTETSILGKTAKLPIAIAPTGAVGFGWRGGDIAVAKAAAHFGIPFSLSTTATASIESIAEAAPGRHWFQAYFFKDREFTFGLIERARQAGYDTLMVTADLPVGGKRERDFRNDFSIPFRFTPKNVLDFATRPAWALDMLLRGAPQLENLTGMAMAVCANSSPWQLNSTPSSFRMKLHTSGGGCDHFNDLAAESGEGSYTAQHNQDEDHGFLAVIVTALIEDQIFDCIEDGNYLKHWILLNLKIKKGAILLRESRLNERHYRDLTRQSQGT